MRKVDSMPNHVRPPVVLLARFIAAEFLKNVLTDDGSQSDMYEAKAKFYTNSGLNPTPDTPLETFTIADLGAAGVDVTFPNTPINVASEVLGLHAEVTVFAGDEPTAEDLHGMLVFNTGMSLLLAIVPFEAPVVIDEEFDAVIVDLVMPQNRRLATGFPLTA